ncbi:MAG: archease [Candidatus Aenigmatarchaeota archaeon]
MRLAVMKKFEFLDISTADVAAAAYGRTLEELYANAAMALMEIVTDTRKVKEAKERRFEVRGHDFKALMFNWLNEVLYVSTSEGMLFSKFRVDIDERTLVLKAVCWGEKLDRKKHDMRGEVKAVTYHRMEIRKDGDYYRAQVIFDV